MYLAFDDSTSDTSPTSEHYQPPRPMEVGRSLNELEWKDFSESLTEGFLPHDAEQRTPFDQTLHFEVGDPHATGGGLPRVYDKSNEEGGPNWLLLFKYLLQQCRHIQHYDAVYLLVDTRDLTKVDNVEPTLAHWPAVAAWWSSRLRYDIGPGDAQVDLVFVRASRDSGLHLIRPGLARRFLFPQTHFILLDSDCVPVPVTLCQAPAQSSGIDGPAHKARKTQQAY